jgi:PadR family transcriptional regulator, regulatory protein AphA
VSTPPRLTTTSYAILGLLAIKPWTTYELTQQMQRSMSRFWPRAESKLYEEPKKLVAHGYATAVVENVGRRQRTVYTVTPEGRRQLAEWLAQPGAGPALEFEQMLKVFFAEHGTKGDLLATIADIQAWAERRAAEDADIAAHYLSGSGRFPARTPQLVLVGRYSADLAEMTARWAVWAREQVEGWPDSPGPATPDWQTLREIAARAAPREPEGDPGGGDPQG